MSDSSTKNADVRKSTNMLYIVLGLITIGAVSLLIGYMLLGLIVKFRYNSMIGDIEEKGEPVSFSEIPIEEVPAKENAAEIIKQANSKIMWLQNSIDEDADDDYWWLAEDEDDNFSLEALREHPDRVRIVRNYIRQSKQCLDLLHEGLQFEKANFNVDYENNESSFFSFLMNSNKLLNHYLNIAIIDNDADKAVEILTDLIRKSVISKNEHTMINRMILEASIFETADKLKLCRDNFEFTETQLILLLKELKKTENIKSITDVLISERCYGIQTFHDDSFFNGSFFNMADYFYGDYAKYLPDRIFKIDALHYLDELSKVIDISKKPLHEINQELRQITDKFEKRKIFFFYYTQSIIQSAVNMLCIDGQSQALAQIARTTLAVDIFKLQYNKLPENLQGVVDAGILENIPVNPFTNELLKYDIFDDDFRVYIDGLTNWSGGLLLEKDKLIDNDRIYWILPEENLQTHKEVDND